MIDQLKKIFGLGPKMDYGQLVKEGAIILDVRTKAEYQAGHINGSVNIPVDALRNNLNKLKNKDLAIITCCASGMRSAAAKNILTASGYKMVYNGGSWSGLMRKIKKT